MYKHCHKRMDKLFLLFSLVMTCVLCTPLFATKAYAQTEQIDQGQISKTDPSLEVLRKESDMAWDEIIQEKRDSSLPKKTNNPKGKGTAKGRKTAHDESSKAPEAYPKNPGMILVTRDRYKGILPLGHAAMVYDKQRVVEALEYGITFGDNDWYITRKTAFGLKVRNISEQQGKEAATWCEKQIGKPYNFAYWKPYRRDAFYCSQLVWAAYKDMYNIEIVKPRQFKFFSAIYPPDLIKSDALEEVYTKIA